MKKNDRKGRNGVLMGCRTGGAAPALVAAIFPRHAGARWGLLNLDHHAARDFPAARHPINPLLDPWRCGSWVMAMEDRIPAFASYGGYGEDRSHLWRGHYMIPSKPIHLGLDITVPMGREIHSATDGRIVDSWADSDRDGGWGGRTVVEFAPGKHLIYAHMNPATLRPKGMALIRGSVIGEIGHPAVNGGWFPHLHVQRVDGDWRDVDGYGTRHDLRRCPDPTTLFE